MERRKSGQARFLWKKFKEQRACSSAGYLPAGRQGATARNMFTVYALESKKDRRIYVGITGNFSQRLNDHNAGKTKSTKGYRPWKLLHYQEVESRSIARQLEKKWKSGSGKEVLRSLKTRPLSATILRSRIRGSWGRDVTSEK
jgi:putative endonuclease